MSITYNAGTKLITISGEASCNFEAIYQADVAGSWGVIDKLIDNTYLLRAFISLTNSTTLSDSSKTIICDASINDNTNTVWFDISANSKMILGLLSGGGKKTGYNGCNIIFMNGIDSGVYSRCNIANWGEVYLYDSVVECKRTDGILLWRTGKWTIYGCRLASDSQGQLNFEGFSNVNNDVANTLVTRAGMWGNLATFSNTRFLDMGFVDLGANTITFRECNFVNNGWLGFYRSTDPTVITSFYDCTLDSFLVTQNNNCVNGSDIYFSVTPTILDINQNPIPSVNIKMYNKDNDLQFEATTDINGTITSQDVLTRRFRAQGLSSNNYTVETNYNSFTLIVSKEGYETYTSTFDLTEKYRSIITIKILRSFSNKEVKAR